MFVLKFSQRPRPEILKGIRGRVITQKLSEIVHISHSGIITVSIIDDVRMQELNYEYRGKDNTTDVLSFGYKQFGGMGSSDTQTLPFTEVVGEILLSESRIISQANEHKHSVKKETEILVIHGLLHILGFDHESDAQYAQMWKYEKPLREYFGLSTQL